MRNKFALLCLAMALGAAGCTDSHLKYVENSVRKMGEGRFEVLSIKKTGKKQAAVTGLPQYEIDFEGEARITAAFEVVGAAEADAGIRSGSLDTIAWQDNDRFLQLFEPARLQPGQTVPFKSSCLLLKTPEYGWICGNIRKTLP